MDSKGKYSLVIINVNRGSNDLRGCDGNTDEIKWIRKISSRLLLCDRLKLQPLSISFGKGALRLHKIKDDTSFTERKDVTETFNGNTLLNN